jgi:hypothetical protein
MLLRLAVLPTGLRGVPSPYTRRFRHGSAIFLPLFATLTYQSCGWSSRAWGPTGELGPWPENLLFSGLRD